jgi:hypothetical protein
MKLRPTTNPKQLPEGRCTDPKAARKAIAAWCFNRIVDALNVRFDPRVHDAEFDSFLNMYLAENPTVEDLQDAMTKYGTDLALKVVTGEPGILVIHRFHDAEAAS